MVSLFHLCLTYLELCLAGYSNLHISVNKIRKQSTSVLKIDIFLQAAIFNLAFTSFVNICDPE